MPLVSIGKIGALLNEKIRKFRNLFQKILEFIAMSTNVLIHFPDAVIERIPEILQRKFVRCSVRKEQVANIADKRLSAISKPQTIPATG